jgi:ferritin-like metal-binding protein YciE
MSFDSLNSILDDHIKELHAAESHLVRELPRMINGASSAELKSMLRDYLAQCREQAETLQDFISMQPAQSIPHHRAVDALLKRALEISERRGNQTLLDIGIILVMREVAILKIAGYEAIKLIAEVLSAQQLLKAIDPCQLNEQQIERAWVVLSEDMIDTVSGEERAQTATEIKGGLSGSRHH